MKTQLSTQLNNINLPVMNTELQATPQVKSLTGTKTFSAAELWDIQRRHRTINPVRRFVY